MENPERVYAVMGRQLAGVIIELGPEKGGIVLGSVLAGRLDRVPAFAPEIPSDTEIDRGEAKERVKLARRIAASLWLLWPIRDERAQAEMGALMDWAFGCGGEMPRWDEIPLPALFRFERSLNRLATTPSDLVTLHERWDAAVRAVAREAS